MITKINLDKLRIYLFLYLFNFIRALFKLPSPYNVKVPLKKRIGNRLLYVTSLGENSALLMHVSI